MHMTIICLRWFANLSQSIPEKSWLFIRAKWLLFLLLSFFLFVVFAIGCIFLIFIEGREQIFYLWVNIFNIFDSWLVFLFCFIFIDIASIKAFASWWSLWVITLKNRFFHFSLFIEIGVWLFLLPFLQVILLIFTSSSISMLSNFGVEQLLAIVLVTQPSLLHAIESDWLLEIASESGRSLKIRIFLPFVPHKIHIFTFL